MTEEPDRLERELFAASIAKPRDSARYVAAMEVAVRTRLADPEVVRHPDLPQLYRDLAREYQVLNRWDDALAAADAFADMGTYTRPDPRCLHAEILMRMGRLAEAELIWSAVRTETPDDVWLYNAAGLEYDAIGNHQTALDWFTDGLRVALRIEGPDEEDPLAGQLAKLRQASLDNLGQPADELQEEATAFLREQAERRHLEALKMHSQTLKEWGVTPGRPIRPTKRAVRPIRPTKPEGGPSRPTKPGGRPIGARVWAWLRRRL